MRSGKWHRTSSHSSVSVSEWTTAAAQGREGPTKDQDYASEDIYYHRVERLRPKPSFRQHGECADSIFLFFHVHSVQNQAFIVSGCVCFFHFFAGLIKGHLKCTPPFRFLEPLVAWLWSLAFSVCCHLHIRPCSDDDSTENKMLLYSGHLGDAFESLPGTLFYIPLRFISLSH